MIFHIKTSTISARFYMELNMLVLLMLGMVHTIGTYTCIMVFVLTVWGTNDTIVIDALIKVLVC